LATRYFFYKDYEFKMDSDDSGVYVSMIHAEPSLIPKPMTIDCTSFYAPVSVEKAVEAILEDYKMNVFKQQQSRNRYHDYTARMSAMALPEGAVESK